MKRSLKVSLIFFFMCATAHSQITFQRGVRRSNSNCLDDAIRSFIMTNDNNYVLAGWLVDGFDNSIYYSWAKADSNGNFLWFNNAGSGWKCRATSIAPSSDKGFIICGQGYDGTDHYPLVIKTDSNGVVLW